MLRHTPLNEQDAYQLSKLAANYGIPRVLDALAVELENWRKHFDDADYQAVITRDVAHLDACAAEVRKGLDGVTR